MLTKSQIENIFSNEDVNIRMKAVGHALMVIFRNQTYYEKINEDSKLHNRIGFNSSDAKRGCGMAKFYAKTGFLTEKQVNYWLTPTATRSSRIIKYWKQLAIAAEIKKKEKVK